MPSQRGGSSNPSSESPQLASTPGNPALSVGWSPSISLECRLKKPSQRARKTQNPGERVGRGGSRNGWWWEEGRNQAGLTSGPEHDVGTKGQMRRGPVSLLAHSVPGEAG